MNKNSKSSKTKQPDSVVVFDTEFTAWQGSMARSWSGPGEFKEIVQIGAIEVDAHTLIELSSFSVFIQPKRNAVLSDYFVKLTQITNKQLSEHGVSFDAGVHEFQKFVRQRPTFCYGRDDIIIGQNAVMRGVGKLWALQASVNLRHWLTSVGIPLAGINSGALAAHVGSVSQGRAHNAVIDARSLHEAVRYLVGKGAPNPYLTVP